MEGKLAYFTNLYSRTVSKIFHQIYLLHPNKSLFQNVKKMTMLQNDKKKITSIASESFCFGTYKHLYVDFYTYSYVGDD